MKIVKRIKFGVLKGYTIRKSKFGWYSIYSSNGVSQTSSQLTLEEANGFVKQKNSKSQ